MSDFAARYVTEPEPLSAHSWLIRSAGGLIAQTGEERLGDPTPCGDWTVRELLVHLAGVNEEYATLAESGEPYEGRPEYAEPVPAFHQQSRRAHQAFAAPGYLTEVRATPLGDQPGRVVVQHVVNEMLVHCWDLACALGVSTDIRPDVAARSLESWKVLFETYPRAGMGANSAAVREAPAGASNADRLAAYLGRRVGPVGRG